MQQAVGSTRDFVPQASACEHKKPGAANLAELCDPLFEARLEVQTGAVEFGGKYAIREGIVSRRHGRRALKTLGERHRTRGQQMLPACGDFGGLLLDRELVMSRFKEGCERLVRSGFAIVNRKRRGRSAGAGRPGPRQAGSRTAAQEPAARPVWLHLRSIASCPKAPGRGRDTIAMSL